MRIVALLAKRLPVRLIPEQRLVAFMGLDVINHRGRRDMPELLAF